MFQAIAWFVDQRKALQLSSSGKRSQLRTYTLSAYSSTILCEVRLRARLVGVHHSKVDTNEDLMIQSVSDRGEAELELTNEAA